MMFGIKKAKKCPDQSKQSKTETDFPRPMGNILGVYERDLQARSQVKDC